MLKSGSALAAMPSSVRKVRTRSTMYGGVRNLYRPDMLPNPVASAPKRDRPPSSAVSAASIAPAISSALHGTVRFFFSPGSASFRKKPSPIAGDHALNPLREPLHDVILHRRHEPKVQEHEPAVLLIQQQVALVRIRVHETGVRELRHARLHRHLRHLQALFRGFQLADLTPVDPLRGEHPRAAVRAGEVRVPPRRANEAEPVVPRVELVHVS
eukprot:30968-Pelagococcus_subviridis.AAC.3